MSAAQRNDKKSKSVILGVLENPVLWGFLAKFTLGVSFFTAGFVFSNTRFFRVNPLFGIPFLAELLIGLAAGAFGYHTLPIIAIRIKNWFEDFVSKEVNKIVSRFWDEQSRRMSTARRERDKRKLEQLRGAVLVDTSVLIDGRLLDIMKTGFLDWEIVVPSAVLDEMHLVADSGDTLKRQRGRRGLDMLGGLRKFAAVKILKDQDDISKESGVDKELVRLAKKYKMKLITLDFNLNKVGRAEGVEVLNINALSKALKTNVLPGESLEVKIVQKGKEEGQGVGYLEDGTMIVVEGAESRRGKVLTVTVARIIQTDAGKMIFCTL